ncbi:hypothetical protein AB0A69_15625 [Streptomyces sp. NPDC045431]|uniref:hypothetical protein n=1 Tax=Streptomyces sp. NPDC045431 TaxID=3155613 RepID=UPI0033F64458
MHAFKRWLDRSLIAQALLIFLVVLGVRAAVDREEHPVWWVVQGVLYTAVAVAVIAAQRRKTARAVGTDPDRLAELNRKVRHREVPTDPGERAAMRRLVDQQLGRLERAGRWLPYWLGFMGLVAVGLLVLGAVGGSWALPLVFAVSVIAFCCWVPWMRRRSLGDHRHMRSALQD